MNQMSKYIFYASIVLNGVLLMFVAGVLPFLLYLSIIINLLLVWFSIKCIKNINNVEEDLDDVMNKTEVFIDHMERVYELEMFYGDETLQSVIDHSKQLINEYIDLQAKYFDVDIIIEETKEEGQNDTSDEETPSTPEE